jgi:hypothetical protein
MGRGVGEGGIGVWVGVGVHAEAVIVDISSAEGPHDTVRIINPPMRIFIASFMATPFAITGGAESQKHTMLRSDIRRIGLRYS